MAPTEAINQKIDQLKQECELTVQSEGKAAQARFTELERAIRATYAQRVGDLEAILTVLATP